MLTEERANELADQLLSKLKGEGWTKRVHENLGWWYSAHNGPISVNPSYGAGKIRYFAMIGNEYRGSGLAIWTSIVDGHHADPNKAVAVAAAKAQKVVAELSVSANYWDKISGKHISDSTVASYKVHVLVPATLWRRYTQHLSKVLSPTAFQQLWQRVHTQLQAENKRRRGSKHMSEVNSAIGIRRALQIIAEEQARIDQGTTRSRGKKEAA